nr:ATP-binding protein [uncultured Roseateles sp.]
MLEFHSTSSSPPAHTPLQRPLNTEFESVLDELQTASLEAVSAPVLVHGGQTILFANSAMQRLLGYGLADLQAMPHYAWATQDFIAPLKAYGERCLSETEQLPALECEAMTANGSIRYLEVTARHCHSAAGKLALLTCMDLSDMRHVQMTLLDVGRVMQQILENSPVPTLVLDANSRVSHWNSGCAQLTGIEAFDIIGSADAWRAFYPEPRPLLAQMLIQPELRPQLEQLYGEALRPSSLVPNAFEMEQFYPHLLGSGRWIFCTAVPLFDVQGKTVGAIATMQDVTERRLAEDALKRHQQELERLVAMRTADALKSHLELDAFMENASVGILCTSGHRISRANKKFSEIFELEDGSAVGEYSRRFFANPQAYTDLVRKAVPVLARGDSLAHEMTMITAAGNEIWVQMIAYSSDAHNPSANVWWLLQDRSDVMRAQRELVRNYGEMKETNARLAEAQSQLLQSEKLASIGQLAAGVAHEINNPVGFVSSNLGTMRRYMESMLQLIGLFECVGVEHLPAAVNAQISQLRKASDFDFIHEDLPLLLQESEEGLNRVKKIVQDLKDFSRVDQSDWQDADINKGLDSTLNVVMNEIKYKAEIKKDYGSLPAVRCLAAQLNQVFMNLIVNAGHAIEQRGEIQLSTRCVDDWVCIKVIDNGSGMPPEVLRRIFDPFFTTKSVGQGTGLGLSLSFSIIQKHGGRIEVESTPGKGTCFQVWIPVRGPDPNAAELPALR